MPPKRRLSAPGRGRIVVVPHPKGAPCQEATFCRLDTRQTSPRARSSGAAAMVLVVACRGAMAKKRVSIDAQQDVQRLDVAWCTGRRHAEAVAIARLLVRLDATCCPGR
jgi:hypothetical protein